MGKEDGNGAFGANDIQSYSLVTVRASKAAPFSGRDCAVQPAPETPNTSITARKLRFKIYTHIMSHLPQFRSRIQACTANALAEFLNSQLLKQNTDV